MSKALKTRRAGTRSNSTAADRLGRATVFSADTFLRLVEWLREENPKPAALAFTAGVERQIAYALEMDVLPEVRALRIREKILRNELEELQKQLKEQEKDRGLNNEGSR